MKAKMKPYKDISDIPSRYIDIDSEIEFTKREQLKFQNELERIEKCLKHLENCRDILESQKSDTHHKEEIDNDHS